MIKNFIVRGLSGEILRIGVCQDSDLLLQAGVDEIAEENTGGWNDSDHYYDGSNYISKLDMSLSIDKITITANNVDTVTITGVPTGTLVNGVNVDDGVVTFTTNQVGTHKLAFSNSPVYKPTVFWVSAI